MDYEKYGKGNNTMINENYYHRTHKNFSRNYDPYYKGKIELHDNPMNLFSISNTDKEVNWIYSKDVKNNDRIGYHQILYALSRLVCIYSNVKLKQWLDRDKTFNSLIKEDNIGRKYLIYKEYKKWALENSGKLRLTERQRKEIAVWILGL